MSLLFCARGFLHVSLLVTALLTIQSVALAQNFNGGNTVSGYVYGADRRPLNDLNVELLDEFNRTIGHGRTSGAGYYEFKGFRAGRYTIRVLTFGTDYEDQEQEFEVQNISFDTPTGSQTGGYSDEIKDFHLKLRPGAPAAGVVFVQEIPSEAEKLYKKALSDLDAKHNDEGLGELRAALEVFPRYYLALERLGNEYLKLSRPETLAAAEILFAAAVDVNRSAFASWYGLAYARYALGKPVDSQIALKKAIEINNRAPQAFLLAGRLSRSMKKYAESEKELLNAKNLSKNSMPDVNWELALLYGNDLGRYAEAAKELKVLLNAGLKAEKIEVVKKLIAEFESKAKKNQGTK